MKILEKNFISYSLNKLMSVVVAFAAITIIILTSSSNAIAGPPAPPPDCWGVYFTDGGTKDLENPPCIIKYHYWWRIDTCETPHRNEAYIEIENISGAEECTANFNAEMYNSFLDAAMTDLLCEVNPWGGQPPLSFIPTCPNYTEIYYRFYRPTCVAPGDSDWDPIIGQYVINIYPCGTSDLPGYCYETYKYCKEPLSGGSYKINSYTVDTGSINLQCPYSIWVVGKQYFCIPLCD
jgi:hypothetical protein